MKEKLGILCEEIGAVLWVALSRAFVVAAIAFGAVFGIVAGFFTALWALADFFPK